MPINQSVLRRVGIPDQLIDLLEAHEFAWFGQRALDCIGLDKFLRFDAIICCDYGLDTEAISSETGATLISLEQDTMVRENWTNASLAKLLEGDIVSRVSAALVTREHELDILAYCSTKGIEELARLSGGHVRILAVPTLIKQFFDNKIRFRRMLPSIGIEPVPGEVKNLEAVEFAETKRQYATPFVVQFPIGAGGFQTYFISSETELELLKKSCTDEEVIVAQYIDGMAPNINAVVLDRDVLLSYPSAQLIGVQECTSLPAGYCGNDFSAASYLPESVMQAMYEQTRKLGGWLRQRGFRGLFGVDFVTDGSAVYPVEVNPRFQGSTQVLTQCQVMKDEIPLALAHVLQILEQGKSIPILSSRLISLYEEPSPLRGGQIILHSKEPTSTVVRGILYPGIYTFESGRPIYHRQGLSLADCRNADEFVLTCAIPRQGTRVEPRAPLLKIQTVRQILDTTTRFLQPWASTICQWAYNALALEQAC
jgi:hypothetical protein